jgi:uncharacterized protein YbjT (DUF2867 family)
MPQSILVVGATGNYGQPVTWQLHKDGFDVRVFTRNRAKAEKIFGDAMPIFEGRVDDDDSLRRALAGCYGVHINLRALLRNDNHQEIMHQGTASVVRLAKEAGVQRLTHLSFLLALPEHSSFPHLKAKVDAEAAVRASGIPYVIFAPSFFMENSRHLVGGKHLFMAANSRPFHYVAADDYARMVSRAFQLPQAPNKRIEVYGPEPISGREVTQRYFATVRPQTRVHFVPNWLAGLYQKLAGNRPLQYSAKVAKFHEQAGEPGDPRQADTSFGRATTTHREWCESERQRLA